MVFFISEIYVWRNECIQHVGVQSYEVFSFDADKNCYFFDGGFKRKLQRKVMLMANFHLGKLDQVLRCMLHDKKKLRKTVNVLTFIH